MLKDEERKSNGQLPSQNQMKEETGMTCHHYLVNGYPYL